MSAVDYFFREVEKHAVMRAHATLFMDARKELTDLRSENERLSKEIQIRIELSEMNVPAFEKLESMVVERGDEIERLQKENETLRKMHAEVIAWGDKGWGSSDAFQLENVRLKKRIKDLESDVFYGGKE